MQQKWSKDIIVKKLIDMYNSGTPLTSSNIRKDTKLTSALYRRNRKNNAFYYFSSLEEAREAVAQKLENQGKIEDAKKIRALKKREWSRESITDELISLHKSGVSLTANNLQDEDSGLSGVIHYKQGGVSKYFSSLEEARELAAKKLEKQGDYENAKKIREYNLPRKAPNKISEQDWEKRRSDLIQILKNKIKNKEDVSYRYQQAKDRPFVSLCKRAFGQYKLAFSAAGLEYENFARHIKKTRKQYLEELIQHISSGADLNRDNIESIAPVLAARLHSLFHGYYNALKEASKILKKRGKVEESKRAEPLLWRFKTRKEQWKNQNKKREKSLEKMISFDFESEYHSSDFNFLKTKGKINGKQVYEFLIKDPEWVTTFQMSQKLGFTCANLKNLRPNFSDRIIQFVEGKRFKYLLHKSIIKDYKKKAVGISPVDSINQNAKRLGISYTKMRSIISNIGLNLAISEKGCKIMSEKDIDLIRLILDRENRIVNNIFESLDPGRFYSFAELDIMRIPINPLNLAVGGEIPCYKEKHIRFLQGKDIINFYKNHDNSRLRPSQSLSLISYLNPHLYTISDLMPILYQARHKLRDNLNTLLEENPNACFRIRKSKERSRIIANDRVIPFLRNWDIKSELQLLDVLQRDRHPPKKKEVEKAIKDLDALINEEGKIKRKDTLAAFRCRDIIREYITEDISIGRADITNRDLSLIYDYMQKRGYNCLELDRDYTLNQVKEMIQDPVLLKKAENYINRAEWALFSSNRAIAVSRVKRRILNLEMLRSKGVSEDYVFQAADEALLKAVKKFDVSKGNQFSTFAYPSIDGPILRAIYRKRPYQTSLDKSIGEDKDSSLVDIFEDGSISIQEQKMESEFKEKIKELISILTPREQEIISRRFGIEREKETLEKIAKDFKLTREGIRQAERRALRKLSVHPKGINLRRAYIDED